MRSGQTMATCHTSTVLNPQAFQNPEAECLKTQRPKLITSLVVTSSDHSNKQGKAQVSALRHVVSSAEILCSEDKTIMMLGPQRGTSLT